MIKVLVSCRMEAERGVSTIWRLKISIFLRKCKYSEGRKDIPGYKGANDK